MSTILIVEDNPQSLYMLEQLLASRGHYIIAAENGEEALRLARQDSPEVIISDIMMPVMNGFTLCREVKNDPGLRTIPFIFYTATFIEKNDEKLAMGLGASRFIIKPTEGEEFLRILDEVLDEHRQGILSIPEGPLEGEETLLEMYDNSIARKLAQTVEKLQDERKALIKSERRLKEAQELTRMGHWELDLKSNSLEWSDEIYRILGFKPQEFDAAHEVFMAAVHPDDKDNVTKVHQDSLVKKMKYDIEYRLSLKDGTVKYVNERLQTIYDDNGTPTCSMGTVQDITERKQAEEALRESEYELSIRNRINEIFLTTPDDQMYEEVLTVILKIMKSTYGVFGYINEEGVWVCPSMTRDVWDQCRVPEKSIIFTKEQWGGIWGRAMVEKKTLYSNKPFSVPEGHIPITRALDVPIIYQGELIGNLLVGNKEEDYGEKDIGELENIAGKLAPILYSRLKIERQEREKEQLESQLQQSQKMESIGVLAGGVAHDFNNILTTILGNAQLIMTGLKEDDPLYEDVNEIKNAGDRAAALTRQLLAFGRKQIIQPKIMALDNLIAGMEKTINRLIPEDIQLKLTLGSDPGHIKVDPVQIDQVIMNLVVNAMDAMPKGGTIAIETSCMELGSEYFSTHGIEKHPGSYIRLAFSDTGMGMDKETQSRIFEPFFTTKEKGKGTGLGLATVYGIVQQNDGFIWVYSEPGEGTTFKIYFPEMYGEEQVDVMSEKPQDLRGTETILIVEDEEMLIRFIRKTLQGCGYRLLEARDGEEALKVNERHKGPIHLILTDVVMPKMSGPELAQRMKDLRPETKVVFMSGYTDDTIGRHGVLLEDVAFIEKPFNQEALALKVREVLGG